MPTDDGADHHSCPLYDLGVWIAGVIQGPEEVYGFSPSQVAPRLGLQLPVAMPALIEQF